MPVNETPNRGMGEKLPPRKLPPDAPAGAVDRLAGGIFVDANGQEVKHRPAPAPAPAPAPHPTPDPYKPPEPPKQG